MHIEKLLLRNFRNFVSEDIEFHPKLNIIKGENGQGKTNLLEAVYYLCTGYSFRTYHNEDLVNWQSENMSLQGIVHKKEIAKTLSVSIIDKTRKLKINGKPAGSVSDYIEEASAVCMSIDDISLIKGNPGVRRNFIDSILCKLSPGYLGRLQRFSKILWQRNRLLYDAEKKYFSKEEMESWTEKLCETGAAMIVKRKELLEELLITASMLENIFSSEKEKLEAKYVSTIEDLSGEIVSAEEIKNLYKLALDKIFAEEKKQKTTLIGPHRDDILFLMNGKSSRKYSSHGQARTISIGLKLAEFALLEEFFKESPVMLLDDILIDLDISRQHNILNYIYDKTQIFLVLGEREIEGLQFKNAMDIMIKEGKIKSAVYEN